MTEHQISKEEPIHVVVFKLLLNLFLLVIPFVVPVFLPPSLIVAYWLLTHVAEWIENRIKGAVNETFIWMLGGCFGMSGLVVETVPGTFPGVLAGVLCFFFMLSLHEGWKKLARLKIRHAPDGPRITKADPLPFAGPNAWSGEVADTPEGEKVRLLSCGEFVMGGPTICDYLLPDGSVILNGGASTGFSPNGRYFVTPAPSRSDWPLMIYDRRKKLLHTCDVGSKFWEIDLVGDMTISGRESPLVSNQNWTVKIDDLIAHSKTQNMVDVGDLKIPEKRWDYIRRYHERNFPEPPCDDGFAVSWELHLPANLMALENPIDPLWNPQGEIIVSGEKSGLLMSMQFPIVIWRNDGQSFVCEASSQSGGEKGWWLWDEQKGWRQVRSRQNLQANIPYAMRLTPDNLDTHNITIPWELLQPCLSEETAGQINSYASYHLELDGQVFEKPIIRQILPLDIGSSEDERVESSPLKDGHKFVWRFLRIEEDISRHIYRCKFQDRRFDGEWLLDHRISSDGRHIALVAHAPHPLVPHRIAIVDSETGILKWVKEAFFFPELQAFSDNCLYLVHVTGRCRFDTLPEGLGAQAYNALDKPNEAAIDPQIMAPPSDYSRNYMSRDDKIRLHYKRTSIVLDGGLWREKP